MTASACDPARCPLCGQPNGCALVVAGNAHTPCWCSSVQIAPQTLARIPAPCRGVACLCRHCAEAQAAAPWPQPASAPHGGSVETHNAPGESESRAVRRAAQ